MEEGVTLLSFGIERGKGDLGTQIWVLPGLRDDGFIKNIMRKCAVP